RPVSRSLTTWAEVTSPYSAKASRRSSAVVLKGRLPTYSFLLMVILSGLTARAERTTHSRPRAARKASKRCRHPPAEGPAPVPSRRARGTACLRQGRLYAATAAERSWVSCEKGLRAD